MNRVISGKRYDTETAKRIHSEWNGMSRSDFRYLTEELYQKKTGEFFIYGDGGAMTAYSVSRGGSTCGGEDIKPVSEEMARQWIEPLVSADEYEEIFGAVEE